MNQFTRLLCASAVVLAATGCDSNYDLSDLDKTVRVVVNDLVVPINIDQITLDNVIDTSDEVQIVDGNYAYVTDGTFNSDPETFEPINANVNKLTPNTLTLASNGMSLDYTVHSAAISDYEFKAENVDNSIDNVTRVYGNVTLKVTLRLSELSSKYASLTISDAKVQLPPLCEIESMNYKGAYDSASGIVDLEPITVNPVADITYIVTTSSVGLQPGSFANHTLTADGHIGFIEGEFKLESLGTYTPDFQPIDITVDYEIPGFTANAIDGTIHYDIEGIDIPRVDLNDLPDVLAQEGTDLKLANPQLYLQVTNPLRQSGVYAETGIELEAVRHSGSNRLFTLDSPTFLIGKGNPMQGEYYNYCLSPVAPANPDPAFTNPEHVSFSQLGQLLSGNGLPNSININLVNPEVPQQDVVCFDLKGFDGIQGKYKFVAPFQLEEGSLVCYRKVDKDWDSEDLEKLTVLSMEVNMTVSTDVPMALKVTGYPLDKRGDRIPGVSIEGADVPAMAANQTVTVRVECPENGFTGLDGIEFTATATASANGKPLSPDMTITLTNVRPRVSGYYETTLD